MIRKMKKLVEDIYTEIKTIPFWYRAVSQKPRGIENYLKSEEVTNMSVEQMQKLNMDSDVIEILKDNPELRCTYIWRYDFKIKREYTGLQNFGYAIYLSNSLDWARRYGDFIFCCGVDSDIIAVVEDWSEDYDTAGTLANKIITFFKQRGLDMYSEQATWFYRLVKKFAGNDKKALLVNDSGKDRLNGQLAVYDTSKIYCSYILHPADAITYRQLRRS